MLLFLSSPTNKIYLMVSGAVIFLHDFLSAGRCQIFFLAYDFRHDFLFKGPKFCFGRCEQHIDLRNLSCSLTFIG